MNLTNHNTVGTARQNITRGKLQTKKAISPFSILNYPIHADDMALKGNFSSQIVPLQPLNWPREEKKTNKCVAI